MMGQGRDHLDGIIDTDQLLMAKLVKQLQRLEQKVEILTVEINRMAESSMNKLYSAREVAGMISPEVHYQTVLSWIRSGDLRPTEGSNKISGWELMRFLQENKKYQSHKVLTGV